MSVENLSRITRCSSRTGRNIKLHDQGDVVTINQRENKKQLREEKIAASVNQRRTEDDFQRIYFRRYVRIAGGWKLIRGFDRKPIRGFVIWASRPRQPNRCPRLLIFKPAFNPATCSPIANPSSFVTTKMNETKSLSILGWIDRSNFLCNAR